MGKGGGKCASRERFASSSRTPRLPAPRHSTTFKPAESSRALGPESSQSSMREPFLPKREETEHDLLKGEDDDLETDVIFDQPETVSESWRHLLSLSPADKMQNGSATKQPPAGASSQVALAASAKEEPTISHHEPKVEVSSIPVARAARKEHVLLGDISTVSSTNIETKPPQHPPLTMDTGVRMVAPGGTKSQLNTKHITPAAESTQVSQVSALPLVVGMVYEMSNQVNKENPSVFKKTNDVKEEATNSAFNVQKPDDPRDEKDTKKMEQENMRRSLLHGSRQPSRVEKRTTLALAEKTLVESVNKGAPVVAQEENYSHIERAPMLPPFESKTQILNESYVEKQPMEDVAPPTIAEMVIPTSRIDVEGVPIKPLERKIPIEEKHALKAEVEDSEAPATFIKEARPKEVPFLESVKQALAAPNHNDPAPAQDAPPVEALENNKPIRDRDPGLGPQVEAPSSLQALVQAEAQHTTSKAIDHEPDQDIWKSWKTKLETEALKGTPNPLLEKPDAPLVTQKALFPPESPQVLMKVETSVDEEKSSTVAHQTLEHSTPNIERAPSPCSQQDQEAPPPSLVGLVQSEEHHKPPTINLKQDNWRSWKRTLESKALKVLLTPQVEKEAPSVVPSKALLTSQYPPVPVPVPRPIPDEVAAPIEETSLQEEAVNRGTPVKEHAVQEEASPLVEKNFIAPEVDGAAPVQTVESPVEEEKAIELEPEVKGTPATKAKNSQVDVAVPIEEAYVEALLAKESPVVEERAVPEVEKGNLALVQVEEQTAIAETPVEKSAVEEEATPLVEEKEFVAPEAEGEGPVEVVESPVEDEGAIELEPEVKGMPAPKKKDARVDVATPIEAYIEALLAKESPVVEEKAISLAEEELASTNVEEEVAIAKTLVEDSAVEEATPFFEQRKFVAPLEEVVAPMEVVESPVDEHTIELEPEVEGMPMTQQKDVGVDVVEPIEEVYEEGPLSKEDPIIEKAVGEAKEKLAPAHVKEKAAFEENPVEESAVEQEAIPLDEKEFVSPEAEVVARVEAVESWFEEEKATELEPEVKGTPLTEKKDVGEDVAAPVDEVYMEAPLAKERPLVEKRPVREAEEELAPGHVGKEAFFEDTPVQESAVEGETNPLVVEKQFIAPNAEGATPVEAVENVDDKKAIVFEPEVEGTPTIEVENIGVDLAGPIDETYKEAPLDEDNLVLEEKVVLEGEEQELVPSHVEDDAAIEDTPVAKSVVEEEAKPLVEEKEFVVPEVAGAGPMEGVESPIMEKKAIESEPNVESEPATEAEDSGGDVGAPVEEAHKEASLSKERPVVEEKTSPKGEEQKLAGSQFVEEAVVEESPVEEFAVEEEARPLVEEKEFIAPEAAGAAVVEVVESPIEEEHATESEPNVESKHATEVEDSRGDVVAPVEEAHEEALLSKENPFVEEKASPEGEDEESPPSQFVEEAAVEGTPMEEFVVEEEARPLVVEKLFVAPEAVDVGPVEWVESPIVEEKGIESKPNVESEPSTEAEDCGVDVAASVEAGHKEAPLSEERPVVEVKESQEGEELAPSQFVQKVAIEESPVEDSAVEEAARPVVEKEFVAPEAAGVGPVERAESLIVEEKGIESEPNVESEPATKVEDCGMDVVALVEAGHEEAPLSEERLVVEEKESPEREEEELAPSQFVQKAAVEDSPVEKFVVEEEARPLVEEKEFVAPKAEDFGGDVGAPVEEAHEEAPLSKKRPVVEEKTSLEREKQELVDSQFVEEPVVEESLVEEFVVEEEARPLVAEKKFVATGVEGVESVETVESPIQEEKAIEWERNVESEPATDMEDSGGDVCAPVEEGHKEAPLSKQSPVVEEKASLEGEEEELAPTQFVEDAAIEGSLVEKSVVEEEVGPLVEEKKFVAADTEGAGRLEGVESPIVELKAIELEPNVESEHTTEVEDSGGDVAAPVEEAHEETPLLEERPVVEEKASPEGEEHELADSQFVEEATVEESLVEESAEEEETRPLVVEKEFIAVDAEDAGPVEFLESPIVEEKAIESDPNVESEPAMEVNDSGGDVAALVEEAHEETPLSEGRPVVEGKTSPEGEEQELVYSQFVKEVAIEESPVEKSGVEEGARPLVAAKEFVAADAEGAGPLEGVDPIEKEKGIELEPNVESELAMEAEDYGGYVGALVEEVQEGAPLSEERPVMEEKASLEGEKQELADSQFVEEAAVEVSPAEESGVEKEVRPLVAEKEFVAADTEGGGPVESLESPIVEEKAIESEANVESEPATEAEDSGVDAVAMVEEAQEQALSSKEKPVLEERAGPEEEEELLTAQFVEEAAVEESPVEESVVEEEARPLVAVKEFLAVDAKAGRPVESLESQIVEDKAIESEPNVESEPATEVEDSGVDVATSVEEVHEQAQLSKESDFVEEKASPKGEEKELAPSQFVEESVMEEELAPSQFVEESAMEEARPLVEEKEFVAVDAEDAGHLEGVESPIVELKAIESKPNVESKHNTEAEDFGVDVPAPVEEAHEEALLSKERPVVEEKASPEGEEQELSDSQFVEEVAVEESPVEVSAVEEETRPLVVEKEFVAADVEGEGPVESLESPIVEEKAIESETNVESEPATDMEDSGRNVVALVEEEHEQAPLSEERPIVEEKASPEGEEEELAPTQFVEEAAVEESPVEEFAVEEEARPLVEEKEFVDADAPGAGPLEGVENLIEEERAIELEPNVESEPAMEAEDSGGYVAPPVEEVHEEAPLSEERPVMEEKVSSKGEEQELVDSQFVEEAAVEDSQVQEFAMEEGARPLVAAKEFVAADAEGAGPVKLLESLIEEEKAIESEVNVESEPATEAEDFGVDVAGPVEVAEEETQLLEESPVVEGKASWEGEEELAPAQFVGEGAFEESPVEESTVKEEARPLVAEKEFVAADTEGGGPVESLESPIVEEKAIEWEPNVESEPATEAEDFGVDVAAPGEEVHEEALLLEESPFMEEKASPEGEEEELAPAQFVEEGAIEETPVEESAVEEEVGPLVEEKEFVAPEAAGARSVEGVQCLVKEEKAIELEPGFEASLFDVAVGIVEVLVEEEKAMDMETNVDVTRGIRKAGLVEVAGVNVDGYVEEPFVVGGYVIGMTDVVDDYFLGNIVRLRKNSEEASVDVHSGDLEFVGALSVPIVFENGAQVASLIGSDIELFGVTGFSPVIEVHGAKKKSDEVSVDVNLEICEDDGGARENPITDNRGFVSEVDGFDLGHIGYSGAGLSEKILSEPFERIEGKGVDVDNMSTMRVAEDKEVVSHGCAKDSMEGSEWELVAPQSVEVPNNTENAIKTREDNEENVQRTKESPSHGIEEKSALATEWEFVAEELQDTHVNSEGPRVQSSPFERVKESTESSDWEMVPTGSGAKDENFAEYIEMTKESAEIADLPIGGERVLNNTSEEKEPTSTRGLDREIPLIIVVRNKDQKTEDVTVDVGVSEIESPLENLQEEKEFSIKSPFNVEHFKKRPLGVATRKLKHVIQEPKIKIHKVVLPTWPPSPITSEEDNTCVDIDHENAPVVESRHVPAVVDVEIIEEPSVATTRENMEVLEDPHTPKNDEQEKTNLSGEEEHDSEAFSQFVSKDIKLVNDKSKDMRVCYNH